MLNYDDIETKHDMNLNMNVFTIFQIIVMVYLH